MWPFDRKSVPETVKLPDNYELVFIDEDNQRWNFKPKKTITAYESALLLPVFFYTPWPVNRFGYIKRNKLMKHFVKAKNETK
jgi:hypothetical protein